MKKPRKSKYGNVKTRVDGILFDSKKEAKRYLELKTLEKAGLIRGLVLQYPVQVVANDKVMFKWIADFVYYEGNERIFEDVKGVRTNVYRLKAKILKIIMGITVRET
jgi:hypothetical protein